MDRGELQEIKEVQSSKFKVRRRTGIALIVTIGLSVLLVVLVSALYVSIAGRHQLSTKRATKSAADYKAEAGMQDAIARLRLFRRGGAGLDPADPAGHAYCLDLEDPAAPLNSCGAPPACQDPCDVRVVISPQDASGLNQISATATY